MLITQIVREHLTGYKKVGFVLWLLCRVSGFAVLVKDIWASGATSFTWGMSWIWNSLSNWMFKKKKKKTMKKHLNPSRVWMRGTSCPTFIRAWIMKKRSIIFMINSDSAVDICQYIYSSGFFFFFAPERI